PGSGTTVRVVADKGNVVRPASDAPPEVTVRREDLGNVPAPDVDRSPRRTPRVGDRLKDTAVNLGAGQLLLDTGRVMEAAQALALVRDDLQRLRRSLEDQPAPAP